MEISLEKKVVASIIVVTEFAGERTAPVVETLFNIVLVVGVESELM